MWAKFPRAKDDVSWSFPVFCEDWSQLSLTEGIQLG